VIGLLPEHCAEAQEEEMDDLYLLLIGGRLCLQQADTLYSLQDNIPSLDWLLKHIPANELVERLLQGQGSPLEVSSILPQAPIGHQEVWAAGVTYKRSEEEREAESGNINIYTKVYHAHRPELFFKALGQHVVGPGEPVGIRFDAKWSVPEPELVVVLNNHLEVVGFTAGNDMSSRDIEGENPLYLPQAKIYTQSCAIGPRIWLQPGASEWPSLTIQLKIQRNGHLVFEGATSSKYIHRKLPELVGFLGRCKSFPDGTFLFTGTGIIPPADFTLQADDQVTVAIEQIGELTNPVQVVGPGWE
jgi:2-dehydro-3-deoxy-D-arabinonate dehydratase